MSPPAHAVRSLTPSASRAVCVGREEDLRRLAQLFAEGERLVTLVGGGGIGKTSLAIEHGRLVAGEIAVHVCDLAEARDEAGLCDVVARVLEVPPSANRSGTAAEQIGRALAARDACLVILDNAEQILSPVARVVTGWLASAPLARFLVTSREPLGLRDEVRHELGPLGLPEHPAQVETSAAGRLLLARIRRARRDFTLDPDERAAAVELLARLDGIPLAIELAAPRIAALGLGPVLARLPRGALDLLRSGPRDAASRHATVRATTEWSWSLLAPHEQAALAQCAVFRGGFLLDAAERVLDLSEHAGAPPILDVVQALREKSLLVATGRPGTAPRYAPYFCVRELAEERLASGWPAESAVGRAAERHARYYLERGERCARGVRRPGGPEALAELRAERDNLLAVAERALGGGPDRGDVAARAVLALWPTVQLDGVFHTFVPRLDAILARLEPTDAHARLRGLLLVTRGGIAWRSARYEDAIVDLDAAAEIARATGDRELLVQARVQRGWARYREGAHDEACRREITEALAMSEQSGDPVHEAEALRLLAGFLLDTGDVEQAWRISARACDVADRAGDVPGGVSAYVIQSVLELQCGEVSLARARLERGHALAAQVGYRPLGAYLCGWRGVVELVDGNLDAARMRLEEATTALGAMGRPEVEGFFRSHLALVLDLLGDADAAREQIDRAQALLRPGPTDSGDRPLPLTVLGIVEARAGRGEAAAAAWDAAREAITQRAEAWQTAIDISEGYADLAAAAEAHARGEGAAAARHVEAARTRTRLATDGPSAGRAVGSSLVVRIARSMLEREIAVRAGAVPAPRAVRTPRHRSGLQLRAGALIVHERGDWFVLPSGHRVECRDRQAPRRLLAVLANARLSTPGQAVPVEALVEAGWPGEHADWDAALNRLRVAINILRRLGLRESVRNERGGYLLDPELPIQVLPSASDPPGDRR